MTERRCKNCRHWGPGHESGPFSHIAPERRQCRLINEKAVPSVNECARVGLASGDYASSDAQLWPGPDFGCVLFATPLPDTARIAAIVELMPPQVFQLLGLNCDSVTVEDASSVIVRVNGGEPQIIEREDGRPIVIESRKYGTGTVRVEVWSTEVSLS